MRNIIEIAKREFYRDMPIKGEYVDICVGDGFETLDIARFATQGIVYSFCGNECMVVGKQLCGYDYGNIRLINDNAANLDVYLSRPISGAVCRLNGKLPLDEDMLIVGIDKVLCSLVVGGRLLYLYQRVGNRAGQHLVQLDNSEYSIVQLSQIGESAVTALIVERLV